MLELVAIPTLGDIPDPGIKFASLVSSTFTPNAAVKPQGGFFITCATGEGHRTKKWRYEALTNHRNCTSAVLKPNSFGVGFQINWQQYYLI